MTEQYSLRQYLYLLAAVMTPALLFTAVVLLSTKAPITGPTQFYAHFRSTNGSLVHVVSTDTTGTWRLAPYVNEGTAPTSTTTEGQSAVAGINGGYFNLSDGQSASYVIIDGQVVADPTKNAALMNNPKLKPHMYQILNRSEVRILTDSNGKTSFDVSPHFAEVKEGQTLVHSLQAGPSLLPAVTAEQEAFLRKDENGNEVDSIGVKRNAARSAIGIRPDGTVLLVAVAGKPQDASSPGMTLEQLSSQMKELGCVQALNLDGGNSTTMFVHPKSDSYGVTVCGKQQETNVKSVLLILLQGN